MLRKDKKRPFTVQTRHADIKVLGTQFDVCAYGTDQEMTTTLESGLVEIFNKETSATMILKPGQQNRLDISTGEMTNVQVKTDLYTHRGVTIFYDLIMILLLMLLKKWSAGMG